MSNLSNTYLAETSRCWCCKVTWSSSTVITGSYVTSTYITPSFHWSTVWCGCSLAIDHSIPSINIISLALALPSHGVHISICHVSVTLTGGNHSTFLGTPLYLSQSSSKWLTPDKSEAFYNRLPCLAISCHHGLIQIQEVCSKVGVCHFIFLLLY